MKKKASIKSTELVDIFQARLGWKKARVKFFVSFIIALCKVQTVCFSRLAQGFEGNARVESNLRRIQRFFAEFFVDTNLIAKLIFSLLPEKPPYRICLDRTNWKYGVANINILMRAVGRDGKIEFVIVASFNPDPNALAKYKDRWQTETAFKVLKSNGFNFEDTHLTDPNRIAKLIALVCVAFIWVYLVGIARNASTPIKIKKHGRRAYSFLNMDWSWSPIAY
jgi:hypothetical protein